MGIEVNSKLVNFTILEMKRLATFSLFCPLILQDDSCYNIITSGLANFNNYQHENTRMRRKQRRKKQAFAKSCGSGP